MIQLNDKKDCCGCSACAQRCPKHCITMVEDKEGFTYPQVDAALCVECGLCEKTCPVINKKQSEIPLAVFAAKNPDEEIRMQSSSGGIFTMLAEHVIHDGGIVFGARWNKDWYVEHNYTSSIDGISCLRSSKYIQSNIVDSYIQAETFLKEGRKVLFSGTPCQISGLKLFLRKEYDNLLTVECVCQSVPSPGLYHKYLQELTAKSKHTINDIQTISFRDKESGWKGYSCSVKYSDGTRYFKYREDDLWMLGYRDGLYTRPSCTECPAKSAFSQADLTLGDLWGVLQLAPELDDDKGLTTVIVRSQKGSDILNKCNISPLKNFTLDEVSVKNLAITTATRKKPRRDEFWNRLQKGQSIMTALRMMTRQPLKIRFRQSISNIYRYFVPRK